MTTPTRRPVNGPGPQPGDDGLDVGHRESGVGEHPGDRRASAARRASCPTGRRVRRGPRRRRSASTARARRPASAWRCRERGRARGTRVGVRLPIPPRRDGRAGARRRPWCRPGGGGRLPHDQRVAVPRAAAGRPSRRSRPRWTGAPSTTRTMPRSGSSTTASGSALAVLQDLTDDTPLFDLRLAAGAARARPRRRGPAGAHRSRLRHPAADRSHRGADAGGQRRDAPASPARGFLKEAHYREAWPVDDGPPVASIGYGDAAPRLAVRRRRRRWSGTTSRPPPRRRSRARPRRRSARRRRRTPRSGRGRGRRRCRG